MKRAIRRLLAGLIAVACATSVVVATAMPAAAEDPVFTVWMSASGSDVSDGLTSATPVKTLARVEQILEATLPSLDVEVRIDQGVYTAQQTDWDFYIPGRTISFMPANYTVGQSVAPLRPVFRGDASTPGWWFYATLPAGHPGGDTGLRFYYLRVERYGGGGLLIDGGNGPNEDGVRVPVGAGANGNTMHQMYFYRLGNKWGAAPAGYAGLDLVNSSTNVITSNHFIALENVTTYVEAIHGIYLAHGSSFNVITGNEFYTITGPPMRTRNVSDFNNIYANTFTRTKDPAYHEWYCGQGCVDNNPGSRLECPSELNVFHENSLVSDYLGGYLDTWGMVLGGTTNSGPAICGPLSGVRLQTYGNTHP